MIAKRIFFIPWGNENTASSRLRVYKPIQYMKKASLKLPKEYKKGDVLIIQKALRYDEMIKAQSEGAKVIYDIDDNFMDKMEFVKMGEQADMVTVGSSFFHRYYPDAPVIDDSLDWDGTTKVEGDHKRLGWHGYGTHAYINAIAPVFEKKGYQIRTIVGEEFMPHYQADGYEVKKWELSTIDKNLAECDLLAFFLGDDDFSQAKGMNKLIKGWAIGLPVYVTYTQEYDRAFRESGIKGFMVRNWETHDFTKPWIPEMREYALKFHPKRIAKQWEDAVKLL
jgi:hypothetical protein